MTSTIPIHHNTTETTFPQAEVSNRLSDELTLLVREQIRMKGDTSPADDRAILTKVINIDSLGVVEILCILDGVLPFLVDESVVRAGGYSSIQDAIADLVPKIDKKWRKYHGRTIS